MPRRHAVAPHRRGGGRFAASLAVLVVAVAVLAPLSAVLVRSVVVDGHVVTDALGRILGQARTWRIVTVTIGQAAVSALAALVVGVPVARVLSRYEFHGRSALRVVATVPFVLPSVVIAAAFATVLGPSGIADLRGTWWAIIAAHVCFNLAVVIRIVGAAMDEVDPDLEDAARMAGLSPLGVDRTVVAPIVAPAVWASALIVFLFCLTSFGVILILGGGWVTTMEVELWNRATRQFDLSGAAVLAGLQALTVVGVLVFAGGGTATHRRPPRSRAPRRVVPRGTAARVSVALAALAVVVICVAPLAALLERSLRIGGGYGLANWTALGSATAGTSLSFEPLGAIGASLRSALPAALVAVVVGVPAAAAVAAKPGGVAARILLLPLAVSATTVGLGLLLLPGSFWDSLRRSGGLVILAQSLVALPLVVRGVSPALASVPPEYTDAAALAGLSRRQSWWRVQLPVVRPAVAATAGLAVLVALGEFGATVFVARRGDPTVPVAIEALLSRPGQAGMGQAMALSVVLAALCGAVLWMVDRVAGGRGSDVGAGYVAL